MPPYIKLVFDAEVVERQRLLNGAELITLEGRSCGAEDWSLVLNYARPKDTGAGPSEGDLTLDASTGAFQASLESGTVEVTFDDIAGDEQQRFSLELRIDDGDGDYERAAGHIRIDGMMTGDSARLDLTVELQ